MEHVDSKTFFKIRKLCVNRKHLNNPNVYTKVQIVFNLWFLNKRKKKTDLQGGPERLATVWHAEY